MRKKTNLRAICTGGILAALYVVLTAINPIGYGIVQLRVSAFISVIPFFHRQYRFPCILAVAIANLFSPLGFLDVVTGVLLWVLAYYAVDTLHIGIPAKCGITAALSGILIGGELSLLTGAPFWITMLSVAVSQGIVFTLAVLIVARLCRAGVLG